MENLNLEIFNAINGYGNNSRLLSILAIIIAKYMIFIVPTYLTLMFLRKNNYLKQQSLFAFYTALVGLLINYIISFFYFSPRPFMLHMGRLLIKHAPDSSFPSDHVTILLSIGFYLLSEIRLRVHGLLFIFFGLIVGLARIYCGVHWPFDIVGSLIVSLFAFIFIAYMKRFLYTPNQRIISTSEKIKRYLSNILKKNFLSIIPLIFIFSILLVFPLK